MVTVRVRVREEGKRARARGGVSCAEREGYVRDGGPYQPDSQSDTASP